MRGVGVSKVGGIFVHKREAGRRPEKSTYRVREAVMPTPPRPDQEVTTRQLADELARLVDEELVAMVRALQQAGPDALFGATEFHLRDLALRIAAKAYQQRLGQKKTATKAPA
jgi:hypothetical protein